MQTISLETITLTYQQGSSDKIYTAAIEPKQNGYVVLFAYGRRGSTLQAGTKTSSPVDYDTAKKIYDKLIREKTAKGYIANGESASYQHAEKQPTGILPQLLNTANDDQLAELLNDPIYVMQQKFDGRRLLLQKENAIIIGINKLGLESGFPKGFADSLRTCDADFLIDGEAVGEEYHVFDLLELDGDDLRGRTYRERYFHLVNLLNAFSHPEIHRVESVYQSQLKRPRFAALKKENAEGVVFKHLDAPSIAGRPASGGSQLKYKFTETASLIVGFVNARRSVSLLTYEGDGVGNVTISANREVPQAGEIIEVRYLYAYRGGSLFQPVYLGKRDDVRAEECTIDQLKFKSEAARVAEQLDSKRTTTP